ncbi:uncharacterized protein LOC129275250 isoform X1 [Lytechinus pictus]|uniref:uncharacterized protein LOC129275250 isoform X1 n=1 Tax=Lytechinus pictus TaxID=7653 RepID=UPI0030B9D017
MGSKGSKIASSPKPKGEEEEEVSSSGASNINTRRRKKDRHGEASSRSPKSNRKKHKRKITLNPLSYHSHSVFSSMEIDKTLRKSSVDVRNKLTDSMKSIRSDASVSDASWYTDNSSVELIDHEVFEYPFENLIFEGGGNKGLAYAGAIRELERVGIWKNIKRLGGASAGAMTAALMAIGYNSYELKEFLSMNLQGYFLDARCATCSLLPNLLRHFGWHPARRLFEWFGDRLEEQTGDADVTFKQLYDRLGKELCIVVTNLNHMDAEYCHVKTTPNMPIRIAVRMSLAIPGLFGAVRCEKQGSHDYYVDGGVLCNYPLHCYDGWWLSMKPQDSMLRRLQPLEDIGKLWDKKERFGTINPKTIGLYLYSSDEQDVMVSKLQRRKMHNVKRPDTKLSKKREGIREVKDAAVREHAIITQALSSFLRLLAESDVDESGSITRKELQQAFSKKVDYFTDGHRRTLFGDNCQVDDIFDYLNHEKDDEITYQELQDFAEKRGVAIQSSFEGYGRKEIKSFGQFLGALSDTLLVNVKRIFTTDEDIGRTIGIDTVYVGTTDFELEEGDIQFLFEQGERAVRSYLRHHVRLHDPPLKKELRGGSTTESTLPYREPKQQFHADPERARDSKQGSAVLSRTNLHAHNLSVNATSQDTLDRSGPLPSRLDSGPPILISEPMEEVPRSRTRLPPLEGTSHRSPSPTRFDVIPMGSRSSLRLGNSPSSSPKLLHGDNCPSTSPRSMSPGLFHGGNTPTRSPRLIHDGYSPNTSPRSRSDGEKLVRAKRGKRSAKDLSNSAFDQNDS